MISDKNKQIVFMHLPKTAGSSIWHVLKRVYTGDITHILAPHPNDVMLEFNTIMQQPKRTKLIGGHMLFGCDQLADPSLSVFTMFRHPVNRLISSYFYSKNSNHDPQSSVTQGRISLEDWLPQLTDNFHIRLLASLDRDEPCTEEHLKIAQDCIQDHIDFVGVTEYFDESLLLLKHHYNWDKYPFYERRNVGSYDQISLEAQSIAEEKCELDVILYNNICQEFERKLQRQSSQFNLELQTFRFINQHIYPKRKLFKNVLSGKS